MSVGRSFAPPSPGIAAVLAPVLLAMVLLASCTADTAPAGRGAGTATTTAADPRANSADQILFWLSAKEVHPLTDASLQTYSDLGVGGFIPVVQWLSGMGGQQKFTGDPRASLAGAEFATQRALHDSRVVSRAHAQGMKMYLGFYLVNLLNPRTPLAEWFDDAAWNGVILPAVADLAGAAKLLGFDGIAVDGEMYPQLGDVTTASWSATYAGNTHTPEETQAQVKRRGQQLMTTILRAFPAVDIQVYAAPFPETWHELVQKEVNGIPSLEGLVHLAFWDGMTSVEGYSAIRFLEAILYKSPALRSATWDSANQYNVNRSYAMFSRRLSNWAYASSRIFVSPFSWIDAGLSEFERARDPDTVAEQLDAFRTWGTGRQFANFSFAPLGEFDYGPYASAVRQAATPAIVDAEPPAVTVSSVTRSGSVVDLAGFATDNLGIRDVRWSTPDHPAGGTMPMTWNMLSGDPAAGWTWQMDWSLQGVPASDSGREITITVTDIKGLVTATTVPIPA